MHAECEASMPIAAIDDEDQLQSENPGGVRRRGDGSRNSRGSSDEG